MRSSADDNNYRTATLQQRLILSVAYYTHKQNPVGHSQCYLSNTQVAKETGSTQQEDRSHQSRRTAVASTETTTSYKNEETSSH